MRLHRGADGVSRLATRLSYGCDALDRRHARRRPAVPRPELEPEPQPHAPPALRPRAAMGPHGRIVELRRPRPATGRRRGGDAVRRLTAGTAGTVSAWPTTTTGSASRPRAATRVTARSRSTGPTS